jgi:hypothetical protein
VEFRRRRPSPQTLDWVERAVGAKVVACRRMTGGITSAVHRLTVGGGYNDVLVLRQYERDLLPRFDNGTAALVRDEAGTLRAVHDAGLPEPDRRAQPGRPRLGYPPGGLGGRLRHPATTAA